jgi:cell division protein FtsL
MNQNEKDTRINTILILILAVAVICTNVTSLLLIYRTQALEDKVQQLEQRVSKE